MSSYLMIDVGAGTMDILCWDAESGEHFKAVAMSPVRCTAREIEQTTGPLAVTGSEMGGGPVTESLKRRAAENEVLISPAAAATLNHDMEKVKEFGLVLADMDRLKRAVSEGTHSAVVLADIRPERIRRIAAELGAAPEFEAVAVCAQDHGVPPRRVSHLDFRHNLFQDMLEESPAPEDLMFSGDQVPEAFNRLRSMVRDAGRLNTREVYVMDSGMAALAGAARDANARGRSPVVVLDMATSHTVAAALQDGEIAGMVEYHTRDITLERLETLIMELADGKIRHDRILAEGGHGAYLRKAVGFDNIQAIVITGPKRGLMADSNLQVRWGAPWGDNMMTGTVGLLEALRRKKGLASVPYI